MSDAQPQAPLTIDYVSPSALETFALCPRKWGFRKIDKLEAPEGTGAALGSAVHAQHEAYLKGEDYDLTTRAGEIAQCTQHLIPEQGSDAEAGFGGYVSVEVDMRVEHHNIQFGGRIDATWLANGGLTIGPPTKAKLVNLAIVLDHKTTRDFKYAKLTKEALLEHPQAPIYALWATKHYKTDWVELRWNYAKTQGRPKALKSWHLVNRGEILQAMQAPVRVARRMLKVIDDVNERRARGEAVSAKDLEKNTEACGAFGGCPYIGVCNPYDIGETPQLERKQPTRTMPKPSFLSSVKDKVAKDEGAGSAINPPEKDVVVTTGETVEDKPAEAEKPKRGRPRKTVEAPSDNVSVAEAIAYETASDAEVGKAFRVLLREVVSAFRGAA